MELSRIVVMLVCFPGMRNVFRRLFAFAPQSKLIGFIITHLKTVIENRRRDKEVCPRDQHATISIIPNHSIL